MALAGLDEDDEKAHKQVELGNICSVCEGYLARGGWILKPLTYWRFSGAGVPIITQDCARLQPSGRHKAKVQFLVCRRRSVLLVRVYRVYQRSAAPQPIVLSMEFPRIQLKHRSTKNLQLH